MEITNIKIGLKNEKKVKAIVEVTLDNQLTIHKIKLIKTDNAYIIKMPSFKTKDEKKFDSVHPTNADFRKYLTNEIANKYLELINKKEKGGNENA